MAFVFNRPPTPPPREVVQNIDLDDDFPSSIHAPSSSHPGLTALLGDAVDMRDKNPRLEILLDKEYIYLKGTGVDVEPARLSGHVALYLAESTSIKEITLQFRGKARLPVPPHES